MTAPDAATGGIGRLGRYLLVGSEKALRIPVGVLISGLASRALGVEDFGLYTSVLVLLTVMAPVASFGLESLGIVMAARSRDAAAFFRDLAAFRLLTGLGAAVLFLAVAAAFFRPAHGQFAVTALIAVGSVLVLRVYELAENLLFAQERLTTLAIVRIVAFLAANVVTVTLLLLAPDLTWLLVLSALETLLLLAMYSTVFRSDIARALHQSADAQALQDAFRQCRAALPVFASGMLVLLLLNADKLLVFRFMGRADSGLYNAAAKLVDVLYFIPMVIGTTHAASFARLATDHRLLDSYRSALLTATWVSSGAALVLALASGLIMPTVFGHPFAEAAGVLACLAPCLVAVTWVSLRTRVLAAMDQRAEILRLTVVAACLHLPLLLIGLNIGTIEAVATAQSAGWLLAAIVVPLLSRKARPMSPLFAIRPVS